MPAIKAPHPHDEPACLIRTPPVPGTARTDACTSPYPDLLVTAVQAGLDQALRLSGTRGRERHQARVPISRVGGDLDVTSVLELARPFGPAPAHRTPHPAPPGGLTPPPSASA
jgi:hypothetical protein